MQIKSPSGRNVFQELNALGNKFGKAAKANRSVSSEDDQSFDK